ncbi:unnamed protein product [Medioppia subpectinata]|uniref:Uncharacterized protein n=1 Tax=Medioppia subpectinata TaxID=1979941 RepID=A0A7R9LCK5_9ACAR|nr:unnamed protein product [Medioppia subpectinata]CAG2117745.1 unnamed protein product [Medioppia subpectinata]
MSLVMLEISALMVYQKLEKNLLRNLTFSTEVTCNGYHSWETSFAYDILVDGKLEKLPITKLAVYFSYLNGDMYEVNTGTVTEGRCAGDVFFSANAYVANDQDGCAGTKGAAAFTIRYIEGRLTGPKCGAICTLDTGLITLNPPVRNN